MDLSKFTATLAGFMTTNDISARDLQIRADRPGLRSDWLNGTKPSHGLFLKCGDVASPTKQA
jgi:hypothetical protein